MTAETETTTTAGATTVEIAVAAEPAPAPVVTAVAVPATPEYVCKKHKARVVRHQDSPDGISVGAKYISMDGVTFCSLCLRDFLKFHIKPMALKATP